MPPGPLSDTSSGEMLSSFQPFSASPNDRVRGFAPATAKMASRRSGSITIPASLTSLSSGSVAPADLAVSRGRRVGLNSGRATIVAKSLAVCCGSGCRWLRCTAGCPWSVVGRRTSVASEGVPPESSSRKITPARPTEIAKRKSSWCNPRMPYRQPLNRWTCRTGASLWQPGHSVFYLSCLTTERGDLQTVDGCAEREPPISASW